MNDIEQKYRLLTINGHDCPITDNPIINGECSGCENYCGFQMNQGFPSVKCSWYSKPNQIEA